MSEINTLRPDKRTVDVQVAMINYVGYNRSNNEDNCCINDFYIPLEQMNDNVSCATSERGQTHLFGVFDGVGGDAHGEVASCEAARFFAEHRDMVLAGCSHTEKITECFRQASNAVHQAAQDSGTTAAVLCIRGATAYLFNVGDSRTYFFHEGLLDVLSEEHTWAAQMGGAPDGPGAHAILRYLGESEDHNLYTPYCAPSIPLESGDVFLLCSDGLTDMVSEADILQILSATPDITEAASALVHAALQSGGRDNITAMLLKITLLGDGNEAS